MGYLKKLFNKLIIVKILLVATATVFLGKLVLTEWFTGFPEVWDFLFGFALTPVHLLVWTILIFLWITFWGRIKEFGQRYARTPAAENLLFPDRAFWFIGSFILVLIIYGLIEAWSWGQVLRKNWSCMVVPGVYLFIGVLLPFVIGRFRKSRRKHEDIKPLKEDESVVQSFSDNPIEIEEQDELGRRNFVDSMFRIIEDYKGGASQVIGMNGGWGDGKTSVLNLLKRKFRRERSELILIDFNPWYFNDESLLVKEFFRTIALEMRARYLVPHLGQHMTAIVKLLQATRAEVGPIGLSLDFGASTTADKILGLKNKVRNSLKSLDKKVVMIIDDLDRLAPEELRLAFKLIRLCGDFHRFIYVLSFDREVICDLLTKAKVSQPQAFLDKIIQIDIQLPEVEKKKVDSFFVGGLNRFFEDFQISLSDAEWERYGELYRDHVSHKIQNLRHAKRLLAAAKSKILETKGEVSVVDVVGLETLRLFANPLWHDISEAPEYYVFPWGLKHFLRRLKLPFEKDKRINLAKEHLEGVLKNVDEGSREFAQRLMTHLFPAAGDALEGVESSSDDLGEEFERQQRVAHPEYLQKYLHQGVPSGIVSDVLVSDTIDNLNRAPNLDPSSTRFLEDFDNHLQNGLLEQFLWKMVVHVQRLNDRGDDVLVRGVCRYADKLPMEDREGYGSAMAVGRHLIYAIANRYKDSPKIQQVLLNAISMCKDMFFAAELIFWCNPEHNSIIKNFENVHLAQLTQVYKDRFKKEYVGPAKDIFLTDLQRMPRILYQVEDPALVTNYILFLFDKRPAYIGKLLFLYVETLKELPRSHWRFGYEGVKNTFEIERLYTYVKAHKEEAYENDDEKWAVEKFMKIYEERELAKKSPVNRNSQPN